MATTHIAYARIAEEMNLLPLRGLTLYDAESDTALHFLQLQDESTWSLTPKLRVNGKGQNKTIGYTVEANIYPITNKFNYHENRLVELLDSFAGKRITTQLLLGLVEPSWIDSESSWTLAPPEVLDDFGVYPFNYLTYPLNGEDYVLKCVNATDKMLLNFGTNLRMSVKFEQSGFTPRAVITLTGFIKSLIDVSAWDENLNNNDKKLFK